MYSHWMRPVLREHECLESDCPVCQSGRVVWGQLVERAVERGPVTCQVMECPGCASERMVVHEIVMLIRCPPVDVFAEDVSALSVQQGVRVVGRCPHCGLVVAKVSIPMGDPLAVRRSIVTYEGQPPARDATTGCGYAGSGLGL